jgi:hypothetical protein
MKSKCKVGCLRLAAWFVAVVPTVSVYIAVATQCHTHPEDMPRNVGTVSVDDTSKPQKPKLFIKHRPLKQGR